MHYHMMHHRDIYIRLLSLCLDPLHAFEMIYELDLYLILHIIYYHMMHHTDMYTRLLLLRAVSLHSFTLTYSSRTCILILHTTSSVTTFIRNDTIVTYCILHITHNFCIHNIHSNWNANHTDACYILHTTSSVTTFLRNDIPITCWYDTLYITS